MTVQERLITAVTAVIPICVPNFYAGKAKEYAEFEVDTHPDWYHDGIPWADISDISLRWYLPSSANALDRKKRLEQSLADAGFDLQNVEDIGEKLFQGYEFDLQYIEMLVGDPEGDNENTR